MAADRPAVQVIGEALTDGVEYFGHELDDVTGIVHAISPQAKKYEAGLDALARVEQLQEAAEVVSAVADPLTFRPEYRESITALRAALRAVQGSIDG